jgi:hypothetical protein
MTTKSELAAELANRLGAKWYRQLDEGEDPRLFDLRADLLLLVQHVTAPMPASRLTCGGCGNNEPTIVYRDGCGDETREECNRCRRSGCGALGPIGGW